jgi:hypothetical protein
MRTADTAPTAHPCGLQQRAQRRELLLNWLALLALLALGLV